MNETQNVLEKWLNIKPIKDNIKNIFYILWDKKKPSYAIWSNTIPNNINFSTKIKWKELNKEIILCGYISNLDEIYNIPIENTYKNVPIIKSHLQKSIRRQNDNLSIQSAWIMIKMDIIAFIRRIIIIMIEDVYLDETIIILQWLLCAVSTNLFSLKRNHIKWLLGVVHMLSIHPKKDNLDKDIDNFIIKDYLNSKILNLKGKEISILYCLAFRISYGGMISDKILFKNAFYLWYERFINNEKNNIKYPIKLISLNIKNLNKEDFLLCSIDFHCSPYILKWIQQKYPEYSVEYIKKLLWNYNSKINIDNLYKYDDWVNIKQHIKSMQKYILTNYA